MPRTKKKSSVSVHRKQHSKKIGFYIIAGLLALLGVYLGWRSFAAVPPPPAGGYFTTMRPVGSFSSLPSDSQAAAMVHRSSWEPRPANNTANHTKPPTTFKTAGYSGMENHAALFGRVTGNFTGTTDEIIQWTAAKWGLRDDVIRAEMVTESNWYQNHKDSNGNPIRNHGYGDYGHCGGSPPPSGYGTGGPSSFGISQIKWCAHKDASAPGYDGWPWSENSTSYNLDYYGALIRGCYEGWDSWLGNGYRSGDLWGCVGRWFAGEWYSTGANDYINNVKANLSSKPWRSWTDLGTGTPSPTVNLTASDTTIISGSSVTLNWTTSNADTCTASNGAIGWAGSKNKDGGSQTLTQSVTKTYDISCTNTGGTASDSVTVTVGTVPTVTITASPNTITSGGSSTLTWTVNGANSCNASGGWTGTKAAGNGSHTQVVSPTSTTTYNLICVNNFGSSPTTSTTVTVSSNPVPIITLNATPNAIKAGASATLAWSTSNATSCTASGAWSGTKTTSGNLLVNPTNTSLYTLNCIGLGGSSSANATITVTASDKIGDINNPPNGDGRVDNADLSYLITRWNTSDARADINDDGLVNFADFSMLITLFGT